MTAKVVQAQAGGLVYGPNLLSELWVDTATMAKIACAHILNGKVESINFTGVDS